MGIFRQQQFMLFDEIILECTYKLYTCCHTSHNIYTIVCKEVFVTNLFLTDRKKFKVYKNKFQRFCTQFEEFYTSKIFHPDYDSYTHRYAIKINLNT